MNEDRGQTFNLVDSTLNYVKLFTIIFFENSDFVDSTLNYAELKRKDRFAVFWPKTYTP